MRLAAKRPPASLRCRKKDKPVEEIFGEIWYLYVINQIHWVIIDRKSVGIMERIRVHGDREARRTRVS
jgi:hypothetical protein